MQLLSLIENLTYDRGLHAEHGLSMFLDTGTCKILFDTGQTGLFVSNAKKLGVDLTAVNFLVLSHAHYDHAGGLESFLKINSSATIVLRNELMKVAELAQHSRFVSIRHLLEYAPNPLLYVADRVELEPSVFVFNSTKQVVTSEVDFCASGQVVYNELFVCVQHASGLIVLTGCAHNGLASVLRQASDGIGCASFSFVCGGIHLRVASRDLIYQTARELNEFSVDKYFLNHCTGLDAFFVLSHQLKARVEYFQAGKRIQI